MNFDIKTAVKDKMFIVAHRGTPGGNIPCNTIASYEIALMQGADMIEIDLNTTSDGRLIIFHPGMEKPHLCFSGSLPETPWEEVKKLRFVNTDNVPTQFGVESFDDLLEHFKGRCYINVDKFWDNPAEIYKAIKRHNMQEQVLVKSGLSDNVIKVLEELAPKLAFMPIVDRTHPRHEELKARSINYIGAEVRNVIDEWENKMLVEVLAEDEQLSNKKTDKMKKLATKWSVENAQALWEKWSNLDDYLMVKYIDGNIKKQAEDGSFLTNGHSPAQPASPSQPGYSEKFLRAIAADHGEVLKVVK